MSSFDIVTQPDWDQHDAIRQQQARARLTATAPASRQRNLKQAAIHFQAPPGLLDAINAALVTRTPLLLTGEPGTGKTQVAWFLARYFDIPLFEYQVRSDSQATDLRYDFDAVAYLRDAYQAGGTVPDVSVSKASEQGDAADRRADPRYLKHGPLWKAYQSPEECILLLDEIDKAPRDFPNDVLQELDQHRFVHPFADGHYVECQGSAPLIVITSNGERRLPDAFLRRCILFHIELTPTLLDRIMGAWSAGGRFPGLADHTIRQQALKRFMAIREIPQLSKKPGAAEFLLWLGVLSARNITLDALADDKETRELPALMCLIKDSADYEHLS
ncbi:MAG: MoxR family ATPase [Thiolinea sp.]